VERDASDSNAQPNNAFEDEDDDEDENEVSSAAIGLKIEQRRLGARFVAFCFASCRFGLG